MAEFGKEDPALKVLHEYMDQYFVAALAFQESIRRNEIHLRLACRLRLLKLKAVMGKHIYACLAMLETIEFHLLPEKVKTFMLETATTNRKGLPNKNIGIDEFGEMQNKDLKQWTHGSDSNKAWDEGEAMVAHCAQHANVVRADMGIRVNKPRSAKFLDIEFDVACGRQAWSERLKGMKLNEQQTDEIANIFRGAEIIQKWWKEKVTDGHLNLFQLPSLSESKASLIWS